MNVIIIGYGRLGRHLVQELRKTGKNPFLIIVDRDETAFDELPIDFNGFALVKDTTDLSLFKEVKIERSDAFFAVTDNPNLNLMLAHIAQELYRVPKVMAGTAPYTQQSSFDFFGVATVNPLADAARKMVASVMAKGGD
jgi:trk system potassium uptake protein TrkA